MDVGKVGDVIDENSGAEVSLSGRCAAMGWYKSWSWADELVHAHHLAGASCRFNWFPVLRSLVSPGFAVCFAVCTSRTGWRVDGGKFSRYHSRSGKKLKSGETKMPEAFMNGGEALLLALVYFEGRVNSVLMVIG